MSEQNKQDKVHISAAAAHAVTAIRLTPLQQVQALLARLGIDYEKDLPKEAYATALYDAICDDRQQILTILPLELIHFLIEIWENDSVHMDEKHWEYVRYLSMLGFVYSQRGSGLFGAADMLFYIEEMKEEFYFLLKSRGSQALIKRYDEWEKVIFGLLYHYGLIGLWDFHQILNQILPEDIPYAEFEAFLMKRCSFWGAGMILRSLDGQTVYFQHGNVEDAGWLMARREHYDVPYFIPDLDTCFKLCAAGGLDNGWDGFTDLVKLIGDELQMDYYRTSVLVRTIIRLIQNGCSLETLYQRAEGLSFAHEAQRVQARGIIERLYESVPLFVLKGYNRTGYSALNNEKQLKKKRKLFTMIEGGKLP